MASFFGLGFMVSAAGLVAFQATILSIPQFIEQSSFKRFFFLFGEIMNQN